MSCTLISQLRARMAPHNNRLHRKAFAPPLESGIMQLIETYENRRAASEDR